MSLVTMTLSTNNAAFDDDPAVEIARILRAVAQRLTMEGVDCIEDDGMALRDFNGNTVGRITYMSDDLLATLEAEAAGLDALAAEDA